MVAEPSVGQGMDAGVERRPRRPAVAPEPPPAPDDRFPAQPDWRLRSAANPLLVAAAPALTLAANPGPLDSPDLRSEFAQVLERFAEDAITAGCSTTAIRAGRLALLALIADATGIDAGDPGEVGSRRFHEALDALRQSPAAHRQELELFHACLALGYEGPDRSRPGDRTRSELYRTLRRLRGPVEPALAPSQPPRPRWRRLMPSVSARWWLVLPILPLAAFWYGLAQDAAVRSDAAAARMAVLVPPGAAIVHRGPPPENAGPALAARIAAALAPETQARALAVLAGADGALVIRVFANGQFPVDGDSVSARLRAVIERVGAVLAAEKGDVAIIGHMDDLFAASDRFPTPEALTKARAEAVRRLLEPKLGAERLSAIGRGAAEPAALNGDAAGRALNRRIDIRLYPF